MYFPQLSEMSREAWQPTRRRENEKKSEIYGSHARNSFERRKKGYNDTQRAVEISGFEVYLLSLNILYIFFLLSRQHNIACWKGRISALNTIACTLFGLSQYEKCVKFDNWQLRSRLRFHLKFEWSSLSLGAILCHCWKLKDVISIDFLFVLRSTPLPKQFETKQQREVLRWPRSCKR